MYLLTWRPKDDKSKLLSKLGFGAENPEALKEAISSLIASNDATYTRSNRFGDYYAVTGSLTGPSGERLLLTVWIQPVDESYYRFVTLVVPK